MDEAQWTLAQPKQDWVFSLSTTKFFLPLALEWDGTASERSDTQSGGPVELKTPAERIGGS